MKEHIYKIASPVMAVISATLLVFFLLLVPHHQPLHAQASSITGYAWSDNIGWVSLNGSSYDLTLAPSGNNQVITGYAWSDNIGWIEFGGLSSFPSAAGTQAINAEVLPSGQVVGWARACAGTLPGDCSSMTSRGDGWDGWIYLGSTGNGDGLTLSNGTLTGFAWGSDVVGWLQFNGSSSCSVTYTCIDNNTESQFTNSQCSTTTTVCANGCGSNGQCMNPPSPANGCLSIGVPSPCTQNARVRSGSTATLYWNITNVNPNSCSVTGTNGDLWSGQPANSQVTTRGIVQSTVYTLSCTGTSGSQFTSTATVNVVPSYQEL